jgi:hypothetical protein
VSFPLAPIYLRVTDPLNLSVLYLYLSIATERAADRVGFPWLPRRIFWILTVTL